MSDEQIEHIVRLVIQRLQPPALVMVTAAAGYRQLIRQRLAVCGYPLRLMLADDIDDAQAWRALGQIITQDARNSALPTGPWRAVLLPFLDYPLAAQLVSGNLQTTEAKRLHEVLLTGTPVLALRYHCDPDSELNQLRGAAHGSAYARHMQKTLAQLPACGITLCTLNDMLERLSSAPAERPETGSAVRYLTRRDVESNPALAGAPHAQLTDAAIDFLKEKKVPYLKK